MTFTEYPAQDQEVLWEKRYDLTEIPGALPKVLLAAHSWDYACLPGLYGLIQQWKRPGKTTLEKHETNYRDAQLNCMAILI